MSDFDAGSIIGSLDLDRDPFELGIALAIRQAEDFEDRDFEATVRVNTHDADEDLDDLDARLDEATRTRDADVNVKVDDHGTIEKIGKDADEASGGGGAGGEGATGGVGKLLGLIVALGPALIPVAGVAAGLGAGMVGAFAQAGVALGAFFAVAKSDWTDMQNAIKAGSAMAGPMKEAADAYQHFEAVFAKVKADTAGPVFGVMTAGLQDAAKLLPEIEPLVVATANGLKAAIAPIAGMLGGPAFKQFLDMVHDDAVPDLTILGQSVAKFGDGFSKALVTINPLTQILVGSIGKLATTFDNFMSGKGLSSFVDYVLQYMPQVSGAFHDLVGTVEHLLQGMATDAAPALGFIATLAKSLSTIDFAPLFTGIGAIVSAVTPLLPQLATLINILLPPLAEILVTVAKDGIVPLVSSIATGLSPVLQALGGFLQTLAPYLGTFLTDISNLANPTGIGFLSALLTDLFKALTPLIPPLFQILDALENVADTILGQLTPVLGPLIAALGTSLLAILKALIPVLPSLTKSLVSLAQSFASIIISLLPILPPMTKLMTDVLSKSVVPTIELIAGAMVGIGKALAFVAPYVEDVLNWLIKLFDKTANDFSIKALGKDFEDLGKDAVALGGWFAQMYNDVVGWVKQMYTDVVDFVLRIYNDVSNAIENTYDDVIAWFKRMYTDAYNYTDHLFTDVADFFKRMYTDVSTAVKNTYDAVTAWFKRMASDAKTYATDAYNDVVGAFKNLWHSVSSTVESFYTSVTGWFSNTFRTVSSTVTTGITNIVTWFSGLANKVISALSGAGKWLVSTGENVVDGFLSGAKKIWSNVIDWFQGLEDDVWNQVQGAGQWLYQIGQDVVQGLINGIESMASSLGSVVGDIAGKITGGLGHLLGIHSPSTVLHEMGVYTMQGFHNGLEEYANSTLVPYVSMLGNEITKAFNPTLDANTTLNTEFSRSGLESVVNSNNTISAKLDQVVLAVKSVDSSTQQVAPGVAAGIGQASTVAQRNALVKARTS